MALALTLTRLFELTERAPKKELAAVGSDCLEVQLAAIQNQGSAQYDECCVELCCAMFHGLY